MMARPKNPQRTDDLLSAAADAVQRKGIAGTTLRPLATELGVAPRTLLYHFGSKENLLVEVIRELRHRQPHINWLLRDSAAPEELGHQLAQAIHHLWREAKRAEARPFLALYFELTTLAIRDPEQYRPLLIEVDREWVETIVGHLLRRGMDGNAARSIADDLLIRYRGALSYALATDRWDAAEASIAELIDETRSRASPQNVAQADQSTPS